MGESTRDEFSITTKRKLAERVGLLCSNPGCRQLTSGPSTEATESVNIGVAAHISAAASGGPRYNPDQSDQERASIENGIWLCQNCAKLIDSNPNFYSVELLQRWKGLAEMEARTRIETPSMTRFTPEEAPPPFRAIMRVQIEEFGLDRPYDTRPWPRISPNNEHGFDKEGMPDWATLWMRLRISNIGQELGWLRLEVDQEASALPMIFDFDKRRLEFNQPIRLEGRTSANPLLFLDFQFRQRNPLVFARTLYDLVATGARYKIVFRFWAERVDGDSQPSDLVIEDDFQAFRDSVLSYWDDFGFAVLAQLARGDTNPPLEK